MRRIAEEGRSVRKANRLMHWGKADDAFYEGFTLMEQL